MARYTPSNKGGELAPINVELEKIKEAIDDTLSRKGDAPNAMQTPLDMNGNRILNLPKPKTANEPARLKDIQAESGLPVQDSNAGKYLQTDGSAATWQQVQATDVQDKSSRTVQDTVTKVDALTVATVAEAKALDVPVGTVVETQGYYSSGDGGANRYVVVASGTGTDDGGSFIDMDNGLQAKGLFPSGYSTPEQFGAIGDGVSDDFNALSSCVGFSKKTVILKDHFTSQPIPVGSKKRIIGLGGSIKIQNGFSNVLSIQGQQYVAIKSLNIVCSGDSQSLASGSGIYINGSSFVNISNCRISNHRGAGVNVYSSSKCNIKGNSFYNSPVQHLDTNSRANADIAVVYGSSDNFIKNNYCNSGQATGIKVQSITGFGSNSRNIVYGNIIKNAKSYGIIAYRQNPDYTQDKVSMTVISNNVVETVFGTILNEATNGYAYGSGIYIQGAEGTLVSSNTVRNTHAGGALISPETFQESLSPAAIGCLNVSGVNISSNIIESAGMLGVEVGLNTNGDPEGQAVINSNIVKSTARQGIRVRERGNVTVSSNVISDISNSGITAQGGGTKFNGLSIYGNKLLNCDAFGISIEDFDDPLISGNYIDTVLIHGISIVSSGNIKIIHNTLKDTSSRGVSISSTCYGRNSLLKGNTATASASGQIAFFVDAYVNIDESNKSTGFANAWGGSFSIIREFYDTQFTASSGNVETDLSFFELPANTFSSNGDSAEVNFYGSTANNSNSKTLKAYVGSDLVFEESLSANQQSDWSLRIILTRRALSAQRCFVEFLQGGNISISQVKYANPNQDEASATNIRVTGTGVQDLDLTCATSKIKTVFY